MFAKLPKLQMLFPFYSPILSVNNKSMQLRNYAAEIKINIRV